MSEDTPKITTVKKEKDPKRVEAGRRLAAISKQAKERKMLERIKSEQTDESWNINYGYLFGAIGVITAIGSLYYARKDDIREEKQIAKNNDDISEKKHVLIKKTELDSLQ